MLVLKIDKALVPIPDFSWSRFRHRGRGRVRGAAPGPVRFGTHLQDQSAPIDEFAVIEPWLVEGFSVQGGGLDVDVCLRVVARLDDERATRIVSAVEVESDAVEQGAAEFIDRLGGSAAVASRRDRWRSSRTRRPSGPDLRRPDIRRPARFHSNGP